MQARPVGGGQSWREISFQLNNFARTDDDSSSSASILMQASFSPNFETQLFYNDKDDCFVRYCCDDEELIRIFRAGGYQLFNEDDGPDTDDKKPAIKLVEEAAKPKLFDEESVIEEAKKEGWVYDMIDNYITCFRDRLIRLAKDRYGKDIPIDKNDDGVERIDIKIKMVAEDFFKFRDAVDQDFKDFIENGMEDEPELS